MKFSSKIIKTLKLLFFQILLASSFILLGCVKYSNSSKETPKIMQDDLENDKTKSSTTIKDDSKNSLANSNPSDNVLKTEENNSKDTSNNSSDVVVPVLEDNSEKEIASKSELEIKIDDFNHLSLDEKIEKWNAVFTSEEINSKLQKTYLTGPKLLHFLNFLNPEAMQKTEDGAKTWNQISEFLSNNSNLKELDKNGIINFGSSWNQIWKIHAGQANSSAENQIIRFNIMNFNLKIENVLWFDLYSMFSSSIEDIILKLHDLQKENKKYQIEFKFKEDIQSLASFFLVSIQSTKASYDPSTPQKQVIYNDFFYDDFDLDIEKLLKINK